MSHYANLFLFPLCPELLDCKTEKWTKSWVTKFKTFQPNATTWDNSHLFKSISLNTKPAPEELANAQQAQHGDNWQCESFLHVIVECDRLRIARSTSSCYESEENQHPPAGLNLRIDVECCRSEISSRFWKKMVLEHVIFFFCSFLFQHRLSLSFLCCKWKVRALETYL